jgi:CHASE2 domain-containing sensor protein
MEIARDFLGAFLLCLVLFAAKEWFVEHSFSGRVFESATYHILQQRLSETLGKYDDVPITIVDISPLEPQEVESGLGGDKATPMRDLLQLLQAVASAGPAAIGIDVDLSPGLDPLQKEPLDVAPGALEFLKGAEKIHQTLAIPVALGIYRTESDPPATRLGFPRYSHLAASMTIPAHESTEVRVMDRFILPKHDGIPDASEKVVSLSAALVPEDRETRAGTVARMLKAMGLIGNANIRESESLQANEFPVDFSPARALLESRIVAKTSADVIRQAHRFSGRIVLIGDGDPDKTDALDTYAIPGGHPGQLIPGIYVHACAAYTLLCAPLFEFTYLGRLLADILVFLIAFGPLAIWRLRRSPDESQVRTREVFLAFLSALILIGLAHTLIRTTRILWTDFVIGIVAIVIHVAAGDIPSKFVLWMEDHMSPLWNRLVKGAR